MLGRGSFHWRVRSSANCYPTCFHMWGERASQPANGRDVRHMGCGFNRWVGKIPWRRVWQPPAVSLPGDSHRQRSLVGYSPWCHKESDTIEVTRHPRGRVIPNILHKERGCLCQERVPKDTVTERAIFYFSLRNSEQKMSHVDLCHLHLSQFAFKNN